MTALASGLFHVSSDVAAAVAAGRPVVALETTLVTHGLPQPDGVRVAAALEDAVSAAVAVEVGCALSEGVLEVEEEGEAVVKAVGTGEADAVEEGVLV